MLPLEVTKPRIGAGRVVKPGDRPALDVRVSLVRAKGFRKPPGLPRTWPAPPGGKKKKIFRRRRRRAARPAAYRAERADALRSRRAPAAVFGTAPRLEPSSG